MKLYQFFPRWDRGIVLCFIYFGFYDAIALFTAEFSIDMPDRVV